MFTYFHANGLWRPLLFNVGNSEIFALSFKCALLNRWKVPIQSFRLPSNHLGYVKSYWSAPLIPVQELSLYIEKFEIWEKWNFCILSHLYTWSKSQSLVVWLLEGALDALEMIQDVWSKALNLLCDDCCSVYLWVYLGEKTVDCF